MHDQGHGEEGVLGICLLRVLVQDYYEALSQHINAAPVAISNKAADCFELLEAVFTRSFQGVKANEVHMLASKY